MKYIILIIILVSFVSCTKEQVDIPAIDLDFDDISASDLFPVIKGEQIIIEENYGNSRVEIFLIRNGLSIKLTDFSLKDYSSNVVVASTKIFYYKQRKYPNEVDQEVFVFSLVDGSTKPLGLTTSTSVFVSPNERYIIAGKSQYWKKDTSYPLEISIPYIYDIETNKIVKSYDYVKEYIPNEYGISLDFEKGGQESEVLVEYSWESPIPKFSFSINWDTLEATVIKKPN